MALRGRRIDNFDNISLAACSQGLPICVSSTSFQKSSIGWPQQPPTVKVGPPGLPIGQKAEASNKEFYKILSQNHTKQRREPNSCLREMIVEIEEQTGNIVSLKNGKEICESTLPHFRVCAPLDCVPLNSPHQPEKLVAIFQCQLDSFCIKLRVSERMSCELSGIFPKNLAYH